MTTDVKMLVLASLLTLGLALVGVLPLVLTKGLRYAAGNRGEQVSLPPWGDRAIRAHRNMLENLAPFAALVLAARVAGVSGDATAWGAQLFFWGRVAHAAIYIAGIPYVRAVAFVVSLTGMLRIARVLLTA